MQKNQDFLSRFGFHKTPFTREIDVKDRFRLDVYDEHLNYLYRAVDKRMSAALIAPAGTGKTVLLRALVDRLPEARYQVHYVKITSLSKRDLCREIATVTGIESTGTYPALIRRLQGRYTDSIDGDAVRPVLILDEAHSIRPDVLSILSVLTNFNMDSRLVVSIILAGQTPLTDLLRQPSLDDVAKRMVHCASLKLMPASDVNRYIKHRCVIAGSTVSLFEPDALTAIYEIARGNFRATDYLALKSLESAHDNESDSVNANHVVEARSLIWV